MTFSTGKRLSRGILLSISKASIQRHEQSDRSKRRLEKSKGPKPPQHMASNKQNDTRQYQKFVGPLDTPAPKNCITSATYSPYRFPPACILDTVELPLPRRIDVSELTRKKKMKIRKRSRDSWHIKKCRARLDFFPKSHWRRGSFSNVIVTSSQLHDSPLCCGISQL